MKWLIHLVIEILPVWGFFLFAFGMLALTQTVILESHGIEHVPSPELALGSLIVAKAVLVVDTFPFVKRLDALPIFPNTARRTGLYLLMSVIVRHLEQLIGAVRKGHSLAETNRTLLQAVLKPHFWILVAWLTLLLLAFTGARELYRRLGKDRFLELFFGTPARGKGEERRRAA
jgi:hypothetical protein